MRTPTLRALVLVPLLALGTTLAMPPTATAALSNQPPPSTATQDVTGGGGAFSAGSDASAVLIFTWTAHAHPPRPKPATRPQASRAARTAVTPHPGACGGWEGLIASLWPASQVPSACKVMMCESGGNPNARNRSGASGLFQLKGHGDMFAAHGWPASSVFDPSRNAIVAHELWAGSGWHPWVCRP